MKARPLLLTVLVSCVLCLPAYASQPQGLAGKLIGNPNLPTTFICANGLPSVGLPSFDWYQFFGAYQLDPNRTVDFNLAFIPFRSGQTYVALDDADAGTFLQILFADGLVNGVPYDRSTWNDVTVRLQPATQDYTITVNGVTGGPFGFGEFCQDKGGCSSIQALRLFAWGGGDNAVAWLDSVSILTEDAIGYTLFYELNFDQCSRPDVTWGGVLVGEPPRRPRMRASFAR
jgi:hypothetical protein